MEYKRYYAYKSIQEVVYILRLPGLQELSTSRSCRSAKRGHIVRIRLAVPTTFATKFGDNDGVDSLVSVSRCPEHAEPQEEGQPRARDHLREEAPILGCQPVALYEPM